MADQHIILLIQRTDMPSSRTYSDFDSLQTFVDGLCKIFEEHLKRMHPNTPSITYDISELFDFLDSMKDVSCLVLSSKHNMYAPYNREWIKEKIYVQLRRQAAE